MNDTVTRSAAHTNMLTAQVDGQVVGRCDGTEHEYQELCRRIGQDVVLDVIDPQRSVDWTHWESTHTLRVLLLDRVIRQVEPNAPLLRKAVEWATDQAENSSPSQWHQSQWISVLSDPVTGSRSEYSRLLGYLYESSTSRCVTDLQIDELLSCGTSFCIAGYVATATTTTGEFRERMATAGGSSWMDSYARNQLDLSTSAGNILFAGDNSIERVRAIAQVLIGEPL